MPKVTLDWAFQPTRANTGSTTGCEKVMVFVPPSERAMMPGEGGALETVAEVEVETGGR